MQQPTAILSSAYFPPVQWMQKLNRRPCIIEQYDHYVKQTYRNRCIIAAANGPQVLTVPIQRTDGSKCLMRDVRISDHGEWRHLHWNALVSAYGESPFFEFYADDIRPFFERRYEFLFDFNLEIVHTLCRLLDVRPHISLSDEYIQMPEPPAAPAAEAPVCDPTAQYVDLRDAIRPKHALPDSDFEARPYYQVYARRHGFLPNISALDLLFCEGPEGIFWL